MKFLNTIWNDLQQGENIDLYLTIIVAIGISALNIFGLASDAWIPTLTLTVLALLAITNLVNRHKMETVIQTQGKRELFVEDYPEIVLSDIEGAKEVYLVGYHLQGTIIRFSKMIRKKLAQNHKVNILLLDPDSDACKYANDSLLYPNSDEEFSNRIRISLSTLGEIARQHPENLSVYLVDHPLPFGAYAINIDSPSGKMYVELYAYKGGGNEEPKFVLSKRDGHWYDFYVTQLKALLKKAKRYTYSAEEKSETS